MLKITLKLYPTEWRALLGLCPNYSVLAKSGLKECAPESIALAEFRAKVTPIQVLMWTNRPDRKQYGFSMPLSVAKILWLDMQMTALSAAEQLLLNKLDLALTNFQFPQL